MNKIEIKTDFIKLDSFLKFAGVTCQGSDAKFMIQEGEVKVNGEVEIRRGKKLVKGDNIEVSGEVYNII